MTPTQELAQMAEVVQAKYEQRQRQFAALVAQENQLRAELARLDEMVRSSDTPAASVLQMKAIGADVIWLAWVGRSKSALNIQLAQVLAQKENDQAAVRLAYGKVLVVTQMRDDAKLETMRNSVQGQLNQAIAQSLPH